MAKRLEWSKRAQGDRLKITEFYAQEASPYIAVAAREAITEAALAAARNPLNYTAKARNRERASTSCAAPRTS